LVRLGDKVFGFGPINARQRYSQRDIEAESPF
jgi:hypothetical protein